MIGRDTSRMSAGVRLASALGAAVPLEAIVGHSYGGAVGAVAGTELDVTTCTFGAPPVADGALEYDSDGNGEFNTALGEYSITREEADGLVEAYELDGDLIPDLSDRPVALPENLIWGGIVPDWLKQFANAEPLGEVHHVENPDFKPELAVAARGAFETLGGLIRSLVTDPDGAADTLRQSITDVFAVAGEAHSMPAMIKGLDGQQEEVPPAPSAAGIDKFFRKRLAAARPIL